MGWMHMQHRMDAYVLDGLYMHWMDVHALMDVIDGMDA